MRLLVELMLERRWSVIQTGEGDFDRALYGPPEDSVILLRLPGLSPGSLPKEHHLLDPQPQVPLEAEDSW